MTTLFKRTIAASLLLGFAAAAPAHAEGTISIARQFGVVYALLNVAEDQKLIEKHGKKNGLEIKVELSLIHISEPTRPY